MKRMILAIVMALSLSSCGVGYYSSTYVDPHPVPVTGLVNITLQPSWGPAGYDYAMYYYFPEFNFYYDVEHALFHYLERGRWIAAKMLPRGPHFPQDLHRYYKVVINQRNPWTNNRHHKTQYKHFKGVYNQRNLRDARRDNPMDQPRRIHYQNNSTPSRNNNTMRPGGGNNNTMRPGNTNRPGSQGNIGSGQRPGQGQRPAGQGGSVSRPNSNPPKGNSSGSVRPGSQGGSKGSATGNRTNSNSSRSSSSSGSRSTGSRGR